jgi:hypothetical protein
MARGLPRYPPRDCTYAPKIAVAYSQIVTISTDSILETNEFRD